MIKNVIIKYLRMGLKSLTKLKFFNPNGVMEHEESVDWYGSFDEPRAACQL